MKTKEKVVPNSVLWQKEATTPEGQADQMIACAMDLSRQRMLNGTASSQEIVFWLKEGSLREKRERVKLEEEIKLLNAKTEQIKADKERDVLYAKAIEAMRMYTPHGPDEI